jgi:hypothetical protein
MQDLLLRRGITKSGLTQSGIPAGIIAGIVLRAQARAILIRGGGDARARCGKKLSGAVQGWRLARSVAANKACHEINRVWTRPSRRAEQVSNADFRLAKDDCRRIVNNRDD